MEKKQFEVVFRGVRGSIPTPITSEQIAEKLSKALQLATPDDLRDAASINAFVQSLPVHIGGCLGGNSSCVQMDVGGEHLVFDAGSGIRELGKKWTVGEFGQGEGRAHIFISHTHWDHIMGIPFFDPIYVPGNHFTIYGVHKDIKARLAGQQKGHYFPIPFKAFRSKIDFVCLRETKSLPIGDATVSWKQNYHPGKSFAYRVEYKGKSVVYATDSEYKKIGPDDLRPVIKFFKDADLLIFDSQYTFVEGIEKKEDWGHSSTFIGIDIALEANVKRLAFYHHEPTYSDFKLMDILQQSQKYLRAIDSKSQLKMFFAHEGMVIDLMKP